MKILHGLPEKVIFCKTCLMSNQRPSSSPEFKKRSTNIKTAGFSSDGICDACKFAEFKKSINWDERYELLGKLCDRFRRDDGHFDVLVPGSGGKDSMFVSHFLQHEFGMNPLTVTWAPHEYTDIGLANMRAWVASGVANVTIHPNPVIHRKFAKEAFLRLLNPFQPFIIGQRSIAPKLALEYDIPFIMYGENQAEAHNDFEENLTSRMEDKHFCSEEDPMDLYLGGRKIAEWTEELKGIEQLRQYLPLNTKRWREFGGEVHYMSYFINWSPQNNFYYAKDNCGFQQNPVGRTEGTYTRMASLDDKMDGQNYFTMLIKFGQGRAMNDANRDIRDGYISREEGLELVNKFDLEFPKENFDWFLGYVGIDEELYWETIDQNRSPHLWYKNNENTWSLKHPTK